MDNESIDAYFLFISELLGNYVAGSGNRQDKTNCGKEGYVQNTLPELDLSKEEDRKELNERIWLERIYDQLDLCLRVPSDDNKALTRYLATEGNTYSIDENVKPSVPIELDCSASMIQIMGILLNDKRMMEMTNVIGSTLEDPWHVDGLARKKVKTVMTPKLYASSATATELWKKAKMSYTAKDVTAIAKELQTGAFGLANSFKDFIINNCKLKPEMLVEIAGEEFTIKCNKFRNVGESTIARKIWDSTDEQYNVVLHTDTKKVPDLEQFRLFFPTCLVHNIDSQIMDEVMGKVMDKYGWGMSIHDAVIISPRAAVDVRKWYSEQLVKVHANRKTILADFFKSIGITGACTDAWEAVKNKVKPFTGDLALELSMPLK